MRKVGFAVLVTVLLTGCGDGNPVPSTTTTYRIPGGSTIKEMCYENVVYITAYKRLSVKFLSNGQVATCEVINEGSK